MPGAFTGTASLTISQMEKMLTVFSPLYELSIFRPVAFRIRRTNETQHGLFSFLSGRICLSEKLVRISLYCALPAQLDNGRRPDMSFTVLEWAGQTSAGSRGH